MSKLHLLLPLLISLYIILTIFNVPTSLVTLTDWNGNISAGKILELTYKLEFSSLSNINEIILQDVILCGDEFVTLAPSPNGTTFDCSEFWCSQAGTSEQYTRCEG